MRIPWSNVKMVSKGDINYINSIFRQVRFHWWLIGFFIRNNRGLANISS